MNNVNVVYTPWTNLKKTADMDVGQIGFHRQKDVSVCCKPVTRWQTVTFPWLELGGLSSAFALKPGNHPLLKVKRDPGGVFGLV